MKLILIFLLALSGFSASAGVKAPRVGNSTNYFLAFSPGTSQVRSFTSSSAQSSALASTTKMIRLVATQNCHIKIAANPTAVADGTNLYILANNPIYLAVDGGEKVAVIRDSADGNLFITEAVNSF